MDQESNEYSGGVVVDNVGDLMPPPRRGEAPGGNVVENKGGKSNDEREITDNNGIVWQVKETEKGDRLYTARAQGSNEKGVPLLVFRNGEEDWQTYSFDPNIPKKVGNQIKRGGEYIVTFKGGHGVFDGGFSVLPLGGERNNLAKIEKVSGKLFKGGRKGVSTIYEMED